MKPQFKFRLYNKVYREMVYFTLHDISVESTERGCRRFVSYNCKNYFFEDVNNVVQAFTGIHDSTGKPIYEGDILAEERELDNDCKTETESTFIFKGEVKFDNGSFYFDENNKHMWLWNTYNTICSMVTVYGDCFNYKYTT